MTFSQGCGSFAIHLSKNKLDRWKLKAKFDIQYSMSVVHLSEMFSIFVGAGTPALHTDESVFTSPCQEMW